MFYCAIRNLQIEKHTIIKLCVKLRNITVQQHKEFDEEGVLIQLCPEHKYFYGLSREDDPHNGLRKMIMNQECLDQKGQFLKNSNQKKKTANSE